MATAGCVVPLLYEEGEEAAKHRPVITGETPALSGTLNQITPNVPELYTIDVEDRDVNDLLYVRIFRDDFESDQRPVFTRDGVEPSGTATRIIEISNASFCAGRSGGFESLFEVIVSNGPFATATGPGAKEFADDPPPDFTTTYWMATCQDPM